MTNSQPNLPPGQQLVARDKWPLIGERRPRGSSEPWTLRIRGCVEKPHTFSLDALRSFPWQERVIDVHCVTRWSKLQVPFAGVALTDVLQEVRPTDAANYISFLARSERNHSTSLTLADTWQLDPLIAFEAEGAPLSASHGGPVRLVVPGRYFYKSLKWLEAIELLAEDQLGFWESTAGYHNLADPWQEQRYIAADLDKTQVKRLLAGRNFSDQNLTSLVVAGFELAGLKAQRAILRNADFRGSDLQQADFSEANLSNAHLEKAQLRQANFSAADVEGANFAGADLRGANFSGASLFGATFLAAGLEARFDAQTTIEPQALDHLTPEQSAWVAARLQET